MFFLKQATDRPKSTVLKPKPNFVIRNVAAINYPRGGNSDFDNESMQYLVQQFTHNLAVGCLCALGTL